MKKIFAAVAVLFFAAAISAQTPKRSLTRHEAYFYANQATGWLKDHDNNVIKRTELVMMFLECDTIGRVTKINLMADNKEDSSLYGVLKKMKPDDFNNRQVNYGAREKVVILPVHSLSYWKDPKNYMEIMRLSFQSPFGTDDMSA